MRWYIKPGISDMTMSYPIIMKPGGTVVGLCFCIPPVLMECERGSYCELNTDGVAIMSTLDVVQITETGELYALD